MGRCCYDKLKDLEPAFDAIRLLKQIKEQKPGIFYFKSEGFLHFHEKDEMIWADVKNGKNWGKEVFIPTRITKSFLVKFKKEVMKRYRKTLSESQIKVSSPHEK